VDIVIAMIAFIALVASWFVLPSSPPAIAAATAHAPSETLAPAA
jgi:hypothetical protein